MKLTLHRESFTDISTIGRLYVDGVEFCYTLEDKDRRLEDGGTKVYGKTCIPRGVYRIVIDFSNKYRRDMPHILDVPQFSGIRIHSGNVAADTEGCVLVGNTKSADFVGKSRETYARLYRVLRAAIDAEETVEIIIT